MKLVLLAQNLFANGQIELRVLMLGLSKAGKTTLRVELGTGIPLVTKPTVGLEITHVSYLRFNMHVWDMGGQPRFRMYWKKIYIVDSADREKFEDSANELHVLLEDDRLGRVPMLVFANKQDVKRSAVNRRLK